MNSPFFDTVSEPVESPPFWTQNWFFELMKLLLGALVLLGLVFGLLRPLFRNLSNAGAAVKEQQRLAGLARADHAAGQGAGLLGQGMAPGGYLAAAAGNRVNAVRGLVEEDPGRVAQVVKHWVSSDE
jgi:flagellar M-ring protein FliF